MQRRLIINALRAASPFLVRRRMPETPRRILIQSTGGFGNTLMATPLIRAVREAFPEAHLALFTSAGGAALLGASPHLDEVHGDAGGGMPYLQQVRGLRAESYDVCFMALNAVVFRHGLRPILSGIPERMIHRYPFRPDDDFTNLYTQVVEKRPGQHDCETNLDLLRQYTGQQDIAAGAMELHLSEAARDGARAKMTALGWAEGVPALVVCPGCSAWFRDKRWPLTHLVPLLEALISDHPDLNVYGFCGPEEQEEAAYLSANVRHPRFRLVQGLTLPEVAAALQLCGHVFSNDSLPVHICSALKIPVAALYGPTDPQLVGPWKTPSVVIQSPCNYAPYFRIPYPPDMAKGDPCMAMIPVDRARGAVEQLLTLQGDRLLA